MDVIGIGMTVTAMDAAVEGAIETTMTAMDVVVEDVMIGTTVILPGNRD